MSDERDPDAAGDENTPTGAMTGPLRPTGKRSRSRDGGVALAEREDTDEALTEEFEALDSGKGKKKVKKAVSGSSRNPFLFVLNYFRQVVAEMKKVIWPNRQQMVNYTIVVLIFLTFMTVLIGLVDLGLAKLMLLVFG